MKINLNQEFLYNQLKKDASILEKYLVYRCNFWDWKKKYFDFSDHNIENCKNDTISKPNKIL